MATKEEIEDARKYFSWVAMEPIPAAKCARLALAGLDALEREAGILEDLERRQAAALVLTSQGIAADKHIAALEAREARVRAAVETLVCQGLREGPCSEELEPIAWCGVCRIRAILDGKDGTP